MSLAGGRSRRRMVVLGRVGVGCLFLGLLSCRSEEPLQTNQPVEFAPGNEGELAKIRAEVMGGPLRLADGESIRIAVRVPPNHHGYLNQGDDGFLIPFTFSFASLEQQGAKVQSVSGPEGERDDKVRATVLRGTGEFVFRLELGGASPSPADAAAEVRYQICSDATGICFRPQETRVPLSFVKS